MNHIDTFCKRVRFFVWHFKYVLNHVDEVIEAEENLTESRSYEGPDYLEKIERANQKLFAAISAANASLGLSLTVVSFILTIVALAITFLTVFI